MIKTVIKIIIKYYIIQFIASKNYRKISFNNALNTKATECFHTTF